MSTRREFLRTAAAATMAGARSMGKPGDDGKRPNVLILFPDQHRFDWVGSNPDLPVRTPVLDRIEKAGMRFTNAVVASPLCAPSRACLAAGKEYDRCRVPGNGFNFPLDQTTFYQLLRNSGYHVMGCGKFDLHKKTEDWGLDGKRLLPEWGFSDGIDNEGKWDGWRNIKNPTGPYNAFLQERGVADVHYNDFAKRRDENQFAYTEPTPLPEDAYCDNWIGQNGINLLNAAPKEKPWFLQVNFSGPHEPMDITRRMDKVCRNRDFPQPNRCQTLTPEIHNAIRQNYSAMVENIDRWCGKLLEEVERRGELDNTLIVFSSDHGEMLGDHNKWKKRVPYQPSVGVPFVVSGPGVKHGVSESLVSVIDVAATSLDYAGVRRPDDMDSRSIRPVLEGNTNHHRAQLLSGLGTWRMVWDGRHKLITGFDPDSNPEKAENPQTFLFDTVKDPLENTNLASEMPDKIRQIAQASWPTKRNL
jgi:arylsulfatase A-like enzyme